MKRALISLICFAACAPVQLEAGRYACDPAQDRSVGSTQCPGESRCGLEGFCHGVGDTSVAWRCASSDDCEAMWSCGLAESGDRQCHDPSTPRAYRCEVDGDCVGGWRCALGQRCVDPSADALVATGAAQSQAVSLTFPEGTKFDQVAVSPRFKTTTGSEQPTFLTIKQGRLGAFVVDVQRSQVQKYDLGALQPIAIASAGPRTFDFRDESMYSGDVLNETPRGYAVLADGGVLAISFFADGGFTQQLVEDYTGALSVPITQLRQGGELGIVPSIVGFSSQPTEYTLISGPKKYLQVDLAEVFGGYVMKDMTSIRTARTGGFECVFAVDNRGLWVSQLADEPDKWNDFEPLEVSGISNLECGAGTGAVLSSVKVAQQHFLSFDGTQAGGRVVGVLDVGPMFATQRTNWLCAPDIGEGLGCGNQIPFRVSMGPCTPCPPSQHLVSYQPVEVAGAEPEVEVQCEVRDGGTSSFYRLSRRTDSNAACERRLVTSHSTLFSSPDLHEFAQHAPGVVAWSSGTAGNFWVGTSASTAVSLVFDRAAVGVALRGVDTRDVIAFADGVMGVPAQGFGMLATATANVDAVVEGETHWVLQGNAVISLEGRTQLADAITVGIIDESGSLPLPRHATRVKSGTNETVLIVSAGTQLYSATVDSVLSGRDPFAVLRSRGGVVNPIQSLAFPDTSAASSYLDGFVVTAGGVQHVVADSAVRWRFEEVTVPSTVVPMEVWFDGARARLGTTDGRVFALPSRVLLAGAVPQGQAVDFEQTCGQQLALATSGLYRLVAAAQGVGTWESVALPAGLFTADGLSQGRIHAVGSDVYVFDREGKTARVTFAPCP